jgi:hypothetical protein
MIDPKKTGPLAPAMFEYETDFDDLTHYLFRYPAKFHPPIVRSLLNRLSEPGQTIYDPFMGSGSLAIEARASGRNAIGVDIDPVAVAIARVKAHRYQVPRLREHAVRLNAKLEGQERPSLEYRHRMFVDLSIKSLKAQLHGLGPYVPAIPQIEHWFRRYVIVDLAKIRREIIRSDIPTSHKRFFDVVFASIIRNASNADPVPVSGLEVTSHMRRKDEEGRLINPFVLFRRALEKALDAIEAFASATTPKNFAKIRQGDATTFDIRNGPPIDAVISSPPYHGAVDYYRRHKLEMYWLAQTRTEADRLQLLDHYIGRVSVPKRNRFLAGDDIGPLSAYWESRIREVKPARANAFRHYQNTMRAVFSRLAEGLCENRPAAIIVGHSRWNGTELPTYDLFEELAGKLFRLDEYHSYPLKNRYMSYTRHNGANIQVEHVLIFRRTRRNTV